MFDRIDTVLNSLLDENVDTGKQVTTERGYPPIQDPRDLPYESSVVNIRLGVPVVLKPTLGVAGAERVVIVFDEDKFTADLRRQVEAFMATKGYKPKPRDAGSGYSNYFPSDFIPK